MCTLSNYTFLHSLMNKYYIVQPLKVAKNYDLKWLCTHDKRYA